MTSADEGQGTYPFEADFRPDSLRLCSPARRLRRNWLRAQPRRRLERGAVANCPRHSLVTRAKCFSRAKAFASRYRGH